MRLVPSSFLTASILVVGACSSSGSNEPGVDPNGSGSDGGNGVPATGPEGVCANASEQDGSLPEPPPEPGLGYLKGTRSYVEAHFYDPAAGKTISLAPRMAVSRLRRPLRGGRPFAFIEDVSEVPTLFKGSAKKSGAAKATFTLSPRSVVAPEPSVDVDSSGAAYYAGELDQQGFVDFFKDGVRLSKGPGRIATTDGSPVSFVDARGSAVAWSVGPSSDKKLMLLWPGQLSEEQLESDSRLGGGWMLAASFSPSARCFAFPAKLVSPTAQIGLGVRCKGEPTRIPASEYGVTIWNAQDGVLWHPSLDRFAAMDYIENKKFVSVASHTGATWSLERLVLPAGEEAAEIALAPDGNNLYVTTGISAARRLFAVELGGATPIPSHVRPIALGSQASITMAGFSSFDRRLALIRRASAFVDVVLVAPDDTMKSIFTTTTDNRIDEVRWAPNGRSLVLRVSGGLPPLTPETSALYLVDAASGAPRKLNEDGQIVYAMKWSDTSEHIGFVAEQGGVTGRLFVVNAAAGAALGAAIDQDVIGFLSDPPR